MPFFGPTASSGSYDPTAVAITGGTATGLTALGIRSTGAAFDLTLATSEVLTAGRKLSFNVGDADRVLAIPASGTVALLGVVNVFTLGQTIQEAVGSSALTLTGATQTANHPLINATQTWNNAAVAFTGLLLNVTKTAADATSKLLDLQVGGTSKFNVGPDGTVYLFGANTQISFSGFGFMQIAPAGQVAVGFWSGNGMVIPAANNICWTDGSLDGTRDLFLKRDGAGLLAQSNSTNAQGLRIYETFTDASNYARLAFITTAGAYSILPEAAGTGTLRTLNISGLPTSASGLPSGTLWNNLGIVNVA